MLTPSPAELLVGVADALAATVLPELTPGPARRQVQAAIGICRRVAGALPALTPHLIEETRDVAATLGRLASAGRPSTPTPGSPARADDLAAAERLPAGPLPSLDDLAALDRRLQEALTLLAGAVAGDGGQGDAAAEVEAELRALLGRMVTRQVDLGLSPWEG